MDSLSQEIIDNLPDERFIFHSSSLVAKRWQTRSQRRAFHRVFFRSESAVNKWHLHTRNDPGRIPSYVKSAGFQSIAKWMDPPLFRCVLENFSSLRTLQIFTMEIPDWMPEPVSRGGFGERITSFHVQCSQCSLSTAISMSLSFPNLQDLLINGLTTTPGEAASPYPILSPRRTLESLYVTDCEERVAEVLENARFTSRHLTLDVKTQSTQKLLVLSSLTVEKLTLFGERLFREDRKSINGDFADFRKNSTFNHAINLPPLPALTSLEVFTGHDPTPHLINALSSISSVPELVSVSIGCWSWPNSRSDLSTTWDSLDTRLTQMAKNATVEGGLVLTLALCPGELVPKMLFPKFGRVAKIITGRTH